MRTHFTLLLATLMLAVLPALAQPSDDQPGSKPPTLPDAIMAAVIQQPTDVEVVFLEDADEAEVTITKEDGTTVYYAKGNANTHDRLAIDTRSWKGKYRITLRTKDKQQQTTVAY